MDTNIDVDDTDLAINTQSLMTKFYAKTASNNLNNYSSDDEPAEIDGKSMIPTFNSQK